MGFLWVLRFFLRDYYGTIEPLATIVTINALGFVFVPALRTSDLGNCCRCCHVADSFFGLFGGAEVDVFGVFDSLAVADFSPTGAGASFLAAS